MKRVLLVALAKTEHERQLPADVLGIRQATVQPAHAEDRHDMRGIADEEHAAVPVVVEAERVGGIDTPPFQLPWFCVADIGKDGADARPEVFLFQGILLAFAFAELVIHAPDIVRLLVDQHRAAGIAGRLEKGAALGRKIVIHADIRDHIPAFIIVAFQAQPEHGADRRARPIGGEHIVGVEPIIALRR
jgi:hypothetical protein